MARRTYDQYCGLAESLDLLGERWTMLILRDLLLGPKRFTDLLERLNGISTGLLSQRLRELEDAGLIEKAMLPPPAASSVYQLTSDGDELRTILLGLIRWGAKRLDEPKIDQSIDAENLALSLSARLEVSQTPVEGYYEFKLDDEVIRLHFKNGRVNIVTSRDVEPLAVIVTNRDTLASLNNGKYGLIEALTNGDIRGEGDAQAIQALIDMFVAS